MPDIKMTVKGYQCGRCGYKWVPRSEKRPAVCPSCRSVYWDRERVRGVKAEK